jgi:HEAT repeats
MAGPKKLLILLALFGVLGGVGWWQRRPVMAWYYVKQLGQASEENRDGWTANVISLDEAAIPSLLTALDNADKKASANLETALLGLLNDWGPGDARSENLLRELNARFGSKAVILRLAGMLVEKRPTGPWLVKSREWALEGMLSKDAATRAAAVQIVLRTPFRKETTLLAEVVPLLKDSSVQVRKTALVALGTARELVSDDELITLLHDSNDEVQNLCELALRRRGLQETHIRMARLISDDRPSARLEVLQLLLHAEDIDPGVWLQRLCQDASPAVRAAAVRAAVAQSQVDMRPCLREMAQKDASPTVRQLAGYYLYRAKPNVDN